MILIVKINSKLSQAVTMLSERLASAVCRLGYNDMKAVRELRLRRGGFLIASTAEGEYYISGDGRFKLSPENAVRIFDEDIEHTYRAALKNSIHSFENEIRQGYVTAPGGNRVGFCGRAVMNGEQLYTVKEISSINIRVSSEIIGCADELYDRLFSRGLCSVIIAGAPSSGKTTLLRDLCRKLSGDYRVSLIDERSELAASVEGHAENNVGDKTDIFSGYPKLEAILTAVRVMAPRVIITDEIGAGDELRAYEYAINSGVKLIASCHAESLTELKRRPIARELISQGAFDCAVFLGTGSFAGRISSLHFLGDKECSDLAAVY